MSHRLPRLLSGAILGVLVTVAALPASAVPVHGAPADNCAKPAEVQAEAPWPAAMLALDSVRPLTRGSGTTVAVLSTGVDATHPQLRGRVLDGFDAVLGTGTAATDCTGTGTQVAGVIAAEVAAGNGIIGVAPSARIVPVRVVPDEPFNAGPAPLAPLTRGIKWATGQGVDVIVVTNPVYQEDPQLRQAVADAVTRGVVVVAAAGDIDAAGGPDVKAFPAAHPDVLGVGAIGPDGEAWAKSPAERFVDLVAPGVAVPTVQRGGGLTQVDGTAVAAGFVGATVALARSKRGNLLGRELLQILVAGASPAPLTRQYGAGVVNPYAALTEQAVEGSARPLPEVHAALPPVTGAERQRRNLALAGAGLAGILVFAVLLITAALRRRSWRPALAAPVPVIEESGEPGPPVMLLDDLTDSRTN